MRVALVVVVALAFADTAWAGPSIWSQDVSLRDARTTQAAHAVKTFNLVGLHWQGPGRVLFRTRSLAGRWSAWHTAAPEAEDQPDSGSVERRARAGWRLGNPYWTGPSDRVEYRLEGVVRRLRGYFVWSPVRRAPLRTMSLANSPPIIPRVGWSADERIRRSPPRYAPAVHFAIVHHTAGATRYSPAVSAAIVRGIELYHVRGNGWNDIGYNFLVDQYGQVFEGRYGGVERNVVGAHAEGFNRGSVGVAVLGNYSARTVSPAARQALVRLLAWRLDVAHVDPRGFLNWLSGGNTRFPAGAPVLLRAISGHRDTGFTTCPGTAFYQQLPQIASEVAASGLPKIYAPTARGSLGRPVRFTARLATAGPWTVTVKDSSGAVVARGAGSGAAVEWTWNASAATPGRYTWTIEAGPDTRPAQGTIGRGQVVPSTPPPRPPPPPPPMPTPMPIPILAALALEPGVISPDGDGVADSTTISYTLAGRAAVTAIVTDAAGAVVATLFSGQLQGARRQSFPWSADGLPDGRFTLTISAAGEDGRVGKVSAPLIVDRTLSSVEVSPPVFSPSDDGTGDPLAISFTLSAAADVTVEIAQAGTGIFVAGVFSGPLQPGSQQVTWNGSTPLGPASDGAYEAAVIVKTALAETRIPVAFTIARRA